MTTSVMSIQKGGVMHRSGGIVAEGIELYDKLQDIEQGLDDRLFPDHPLYCEGMAKPKLRGMMHLVYAMMLPLGIIHLYTEANGNFQGQLAAIIFVLGNLYCVGISALYHTVNWSMSTEIFIQKLDHCGISVYAAAVNFPTAFLLLPEDQGSLLLLLTITTCAWSCWHILSSRPAVWRFVVVSSVIVLFFPILYSKFSSFEWTCAMLNIVTQGTGMAVFVRQKPDPWPAVCGYHELFHFICVVGMTIVYLCNWSIIRRVCNPEAPYTEVLDILLPMLWRPV